MNADPRSSHSLQCKRPSRTSQVVFSLREPLPSDSLSRHNSRVPHICPVLADVGEHETIPAPMPGFGRCGKAQNHPGPTSGLHQGTALHFAESPIL